MDSSFPLMQTRCYQQAARLMSKGVSLSIALRGCMRERGAHPSDTRNPPGPRRQWKAAPGERQSP